MIIRLTLALALTLFSINAFAQDLIYLNRERPVEVKIVEVNDSTVIYKAIGDADAPLQETALDNVLRIVYGNGKDLNLKSLDEMIVSRLNHIDYKWGNFYDANGTISKSDISDYLGVSLYGGHYLEAMKTYRKGVVMTIGGLCVTGAAIAFIEMDKTYFGSASKKAYKALRGVACAGAVSTVAGIPIWVKGDRSLRKIADEYNRTYGNKDLAYAPTLSIGSTQNGIGLIYSF